MGWHGNSNTNMKAIFVNKTNNGDNYFKICHETGLTGSRNIRMKYYCKPTRTQCEFYNSNKPLGKCSIGNNSPIRESIINQVCKSIRGTFINGKCIKAKSCFPSFSVCAVGTTKKNESMRIRFVAKIAYEQVGRGGAQQISGGHWGKHVTYNGDKSTTIMSSGHKQWADNKVALNAEGDALGMAYCSNSDISSDCNITSISYCSNKVTGGYAGRNTQDQADQVFKNCTYNVSKNTNFTTTISDYHLKNKGLRKSYWGYQGLPLFTSWDIVFPHQCCAK